MTSNPHRDPILKSLAVVFWLLVWQVTASLANRSLLLPLPTPVETAAALISMARSVSFWIMITASLFRICAGFLSALILGTVCAFISSRSDIFRILTAPLLELIRAIPVASFTILIFLWVNRDRIPSVISFLTVFPIVWANVENGARSMDRSLVELATVFGMSRGDILRKIILPGIRPFFLSAMASGMGFAWKSGVAAEVICRTTNSLGNELWAGKTALEYNEVFAVTLVIVLLSSLLQIPAKRLIREGGKHDHP